jgi:hypothetical protein
MLIYGGDGRALALYLRGRRAAVLASCAEECDRLRAGPADPGASEAALARDAADAAADACRLASRLLATGRGLADVALHLCEALCLACADACAATGGDAARRCALACRRAALEAADAAAQLEG